MGWKYNYGVSADLRVAIGMAFVAHVSHDAFEIFKNQFFFDLL